MTTPRILFALLVSIFLAACSGGGDSSSTQDPVPAIGTVGLFLTDDPSDDFAQINVNVTEAVLIGDGGQQSIFQGSKKIDLLDLTNYNEPVVFGEVVAGTYTKVRLYIDELQLVPHDRSASIYPQLPANGKIDLLDQGGFEVYAGRTVIVEIDIDANKSIKITETGKDRKYNFRPVVKVNVMDGGLPDKLARIEGYVWSIPGDPAGRFVVCPVDVAHTTDAEVPAACVEVQSDDGTSFFDEDGQASSFAALMVNDSVVVIGRYEIEPEILLNAVVVEIGGTAQQINGKAVSKPVDGQFLMLMDDGTEVIVEVQKGTRFFDETGEIMPDTIQIGANLEIEGVYPPQVDNIGPRLFRAALIFVETEDDELLSGSIIEPLDTVNRSFGLSTSGGDTCVRVKNDASILLVDTGLSEVTAGTINDLELGQAVDVFGITATDSCFDANEVIVNVVGAL